jgi:hypothetical protein
MPANTMGTVAVTAFAALAAGAADATMRSTGSRTSSSAKRGSCSTPPSVSRNSHARFRPSTYPRSHNPF